MKNKWLNRFMRFVDLREYVDVEASAAAIRDNVAFRGPNIVILFCAIVIASVGLNVNSIPVIIGAMLISPLMSPIIGFGLALGTNDTRLLWFSLKHLGLMVGVSILAATLYWLLSPLDMEHPTELLARTNPTIYDVLIAFFGGLAGILENSRKEKGTVLAGVAIATALMPPLCTVGYGIATLNSHFFFGALYLFFINFTFISLSAFLGVKYLGYHVIASQDPTKERYRRWMVGIFMVAIIVPSIFSAITVVRENNFSRNVNAFVKENKNFSRSYIYDYTVNTTERPQTVELYIAGEEPDSVARMNLYKSAEQYGLLASQIHFHLDAAYVAQQGLDENQLVRDIFQSNEEKITYKNQQIAALTAERDSLQQAIETLIADAILPEQAIEAEIKTQYENVESVVLARGADGEMVIVMKMHQHKMLPTHDIDKLRAWLKLRLENNTVMVLQY